MNTQIDTREVLPAIRVPSLLHLPHRRRRRAGRRGPVDRRADPERTLRGAARIGSPDVGRRRRRDPRRDRRVPDRCPARTRARSRAHDRAVHGHRRLDPARRVDGRPRLVGPARASPCRDPAGAQPVPESRGRHGGRRLPGSFDGPARAVGCAIAAGEAVRASASRSVPGSIRARSSWSATRCPRPRRAHRRSGRRARRAGRGPRDQHREGPGCRFGARLRRLAGGHVLEGACPTSGVSHRVVK